MRPVSEQTPVARRRLLILSPRDSIISDYVETGVVTTFLKIEWVLGKVAHGHHRRGIQSVRALFLLARFQSFFGSMSALLPSMTTMPRVES